MRVQVEHSYLFNALSLMFQGHRVRSLLCLKGRTQGFLELLQWSVCKPPPPLASIGNPSQISEVGPLRGPGGTFAWAALTHVDKNAP